MKSELSRIVLENGFNETEQQCDKLFPGNVERPIDPSTVERLLVKDEEDNIHQSQNVITETKEYVTFMSKHSVIQSLIAVSASFMLTLSAFDSFSNLQSTLNTSEGLGTLGLALIAMFMIFTSLFVTTWTMSRFETKRVMVCSLMTYGVYMSTGFYPSWYTVIPTSVVIAVGASHLWLAVVIYVTDIAKQYATLTNTKEQDRINLFIGVFFGFMYTSQVWGNLISSLVFQRSSYDEGNSTNENCGSTFCPRSVENNTIILLPSNKQVYTFTGICIGLSIVAVGVLAIFGSAVKSGTHTRPTILKTLKQVTKHLMTSRNQQLLIIPSIFAGLWNGFAVGDYTMAYISCTYGIENVGFVMITFGVGQSLCSVLFGKLSQYTGNFLIYLLGFLAMTSVLLALLLWQPDQHTFYVAFILAFLFGLGVAVNNPVVIAHYNLYLKDNRETAQSSFRLLNSLGWAVAFGYSSVLCTNYKIYILLCILVISFICVAILNYTRGKSKAVI